mmetsp:Transcript_6782/g.12828  ORF Transcript_6782/g.12828 Transcript_6782/m.12828 type:complete len:225 (-) Transcript_6782:19-693(-)
MRLWGCARSKTRLETSPYASGEVELHGPRGAMWDTLRAFPRRLVFVGGDAVCAALRPPCLRPHRQKKWSPSLSPCYWGVTGNAAIGERVRIRWHNARISPSKGRFAPLRVAHGLQSDPSYGGEKRLESCVAETSAGKKQGAWDRNFRIPEKRRHQEMTRNGHRQFSPLCRQIGASFSQRRWAPDFSVQIVSDVEQRSVQSYSSGLLETYSYLMYLKIVMLLITC